MVAFISEEELTEKMVSKVYYFVEICIACGLCSDAETEVAFIYRVGGTFTTGYLHLGTHPVSNSAWHNLTWVAVQLYCEG